VVTFSQTLYNLCSNLTSVSNVYEAAPRALFWAPNGLIEFPIEQGLFNKPTMAFTQILGPEEGALSIKVPSSLRKQPTFGDATTGFPAK